MDAADVLIVGGGPAGSACAWRLVQAGLNVIVIDAATFPRDKVCAGWITPPLVDELRLDLDDYGRGRTLQPIDGFRIGVIGRSAATEVTYDHPISYGIRRCEFDHYLLKRSLARLATGEPVRTLERRRDRWIVNGRFSAPLLIGAGGHFCPVARRLNPAPMKSRVVAAQECELEEPSPSAAHRVSRTHPELYFSPDLRGYGWIFRKGGVINIGFGSLERSGLPRSVNTFTTFLQNQGRIPARRTWPWRGHAYRLYESDPHRTIVGDGVLLVGDAAGLAYPESGEGIRPAVESGLLAAGVVVDAGGGAGRIALAPYEARLRRRFGGAPRRGTPRTALPPGLVAMAGRELLRVPWFVRRVVLDRWFLHAGEEALAS